jgi:sec-independent protein translocase protein TatA
MGSFSPTHWLIVVLVAAVLFGPSRLATLGKGLGEGIRSFKKGLDTDVSGEGSAEDAKDRRASKGR